METGEGVGSGDEDDPPKTGRSLANLEGKRDLAHESREFAEYLRMLRKRTGLTSQKLEAELGMGAGSMSRYLSGERLPKLAWLRRFQDWVKASTDAGLTHEERDQGRDLLYAAAANKNILIVHEVELEDRDGRLADRIAVVEQDIDMIQDQLAAERATREKDQTKIAELEEQLTQLDTLAKVLQAERVAVATIADAVATPEQVMNVAAWKDSPPPAVWGPVPSRNPDFAGRAELLRHLGHQLVPLDGSPARPQVLHGTAGTGKSQLVVEYVHRHAGDYDMVWWISAEHQATVHHAFVELAKRMNIQASSAEIAVPAVLEALRVSESHRRWLLVFDNAERPDSIRGFLPGGRGHVLITSRNPFWEGVARPVRVGLFTRAESRELLRRRGVDIDADELAEALGDLPAAVDQVGSWLSRTGTSVSECLRLLAGDGTALLQVQQSGGDHALPVGAIWNVPLARIKAEDRQALSLLRLCAFFAPARIPHALVAKAERTSESESDDREPYETIRLRNALQHLAQCSLVEVDRRDDSLALHPLLQVVVRGQMDLELQEKSRHAVHAALAAHDPGDPDDAANWPLYATLFPHVVHSKAVDCRSAETARLIENLLRWLLVAGNADTARTLARQSLTAHEARQAQDADAISGTRPSTDTAPRELEAP
ncbi:FxSxx-COOH system tetratricopeptide repeat protein [Streptomyces sp. ID05-26A]|nr:FxSxx-COOH system tetratricopeptide repeat protein [Streptomyces sp. ID05-26A]